ncbi:MAG TPA: aminotransferase class I/II-fold pyridoxal phosphate-dependent enzyme [Rhizobiales bacterium]|nr:aminotransferase class I/II-fold pyridoxal phosphate-dependent enzyme [Hyphomicrobiales bacterium]
MPELKDLPTPDLREFHERCVNDFAAFRTRAMKIDMTRGKPSTAQLDLSNALLRLPENVDYHLADGSDARNYGGPVQGLPEARELFTGLLGAPAGQIIVANNSSLALMHDCIAYALLRGVPGGSAPWRDWEKTSFLCPVPGYDRHFAICEEYGIDMIPVEMTGSGPDMDEVERLVVSREVKGMWCVPKYSNPSGDIYDDETVRRLAAMKAGAADFRLFWDNAYALHNLSDARADILNILEVCEQAGAPDRAFVFGSTSKITFGGGGLGLFASSMANVAWLAGAMKKRSIGPDKLNQLRHVRYLKDAAGLDRLMESHRDIIAPKFRAVDGVFNTHLEGTGAATWTRPEGGYFISVNVMDGCARRVVELANQAGVALVPAGATFPYGKDPRDRNLRVAPTYPALADLAPASEGIALSILLAVTEKLLSERN